MTQPTCPQLVIATDISQPPGVTMWRKGETAATATTAATSSRRALTRETAQKDGARAQGDAGGAVLGFIRARAEGRQTASWKITPTVCRLPE